MAQKNCTYIAIDLKSFYASVECVWKILSAASFVVLTAVGNSDRFEKKVIVK